MRVINVHHREFTASFSEVGALLDSLSSPSDRLWPRQSPPMHLDRPLQVGALGGHGPIKYQVEQYTPRALVIFRFTAPAGFHGTHSFSVVPLSGIQGVRVTHRLEMTTSGRATWLWLAAIRPLHNALIEDAFDRVSLELKLPCVPRTWSAWVRMLRLAMRPRRKVAA